MLGDNTLLFSVVYHVLMLSVPPAGYQRDSMRGPLYQCHCSVKGQHGRLDRDWYSGGQGQHLAVRLRTQTC